MAKKKLLVTELYLVKLIASFIKHKATQGTKHCNEVVLVEAQHNINTQTHQNKHLSLHIRKNHPEPPEFFAAPNAHGHLEGPGRVPLPGCMVAVKRNRGLKWIRPPSDSPTVELAKFSRVFFGGSMENTSESRPKTKSSPQQLRGTQFFFQ